MGEYQYIAIDGSGREVRGVVAADSRPGAIAALATRSVFVTELKDAAAGEAAPLIAWRPWGPRRLRLRVKAVLFRQLGTALRAGLPLLSALQVVHEQAEGETTRTLLSDLTARVHAGESLSQAMEAHPSDFSRLEVSMIRVGETAGMLDQIMGHLSDFSERDVDVREKIRSAAAYPLFVLTLALISVVIIVTFILPRVLGAVADNVAVLPWPTVVLMRLSDSASYGWLLLVALAAGIWAMRRWLAKSDGRRKFDAFKLRIPVLGTALRRIAVARFARTLGTLSRSGIPILEALRVLRDTLGNEALAQQIDAVAADITQGQSIAEPLRLTGQFPPLLIQVIAMGERTGRLDELLLEAADAYEKETSAAIERTMTILPGVFIVLLALVVLFVLSGVLLPIVNMSTSMPGM